MSPTSAQTKTHAFQRSRLERFMREEKTLCAYAVSNLTPEHFEDYRDRRLKQRNGKGKTIAPGTVKRELTLFKRVIDNRKRRLGVIINPENTAYVVRPAVNDVRDVRLTKSEFTKLLKDCPEASNSWLRPIVEFDFETCGRRGSLPKLEWNDLDLAKRTATFRDVKNSANPEQVIDQSEALSPRVIEILEDFPRSEDGRVFPLTPNAFRLAFNRGRKMAGVEHVRFHEPHHERVSSLFEAGWSDAAVMAISGHRDPKSMKRNANLKLDPLADELAKLANQ